MPIASTITGVDLAFESFGSDCDPAVVLIAGFGAQLISWDQRLCQRVADRGRRVIRFDNRDCGLSTKIDTASVDLDSVISFAAAGDLDAVRTLVPYTLHDMADDVVGLLDALGIADAHIIGASMGGMIAQLVAIRHPDRAITLTSISSSTGESAFGESTPEAMAALLGPPSSDRSEFVASAVANGKIWGSRRHFDTGAVASHAGHSFDRCLCPEGTARQLGALLATGSLAANLGNLSVPTLVIHGLDDTLIAPSGGERTAALIPGARLMLVEDMGHDRPEPLWHSLVDAIAVHTEARSGPTIH